MMLSVLWKKSAMNELARLWTEADSELRELITSATHDMDQKLRTDPLLDSESRPGGRYIRFDFPLGITFRLESDGQTVSVLRVWLIRKREK